MQGEFQKLRSEETMSVLENVDAVSIKAPLKLSTQILN